MELLKGVFQSALKLWISLPSSAKNPTNQLSQFPQNPDSVTKSATVSWVPICCIQFVSQRHGFADGND